MNDEPTAQQGAQEDTELDAELDAELRALRSGEACLLERRDLIVAAGPDTTPFLQGQLAQNIETLADGAVAWSLLLQPTGRLIAFVRLRRVDSDTVQIDVEAGVGRAVQAALSRFLIRTKCALTLTESVSSYWCATTAGLPADAIAMAASPWPGVVSIHPSGNHDGAPEPHQSILPLVSADAAERWRVLCGIPRHGAELTESTIPSETGLLSVAVAFGKGCYTGQELVERIDSRGRVVRALMQLRSPKPLQSAAAITDAAGSDRGIITSGVRLPDGGWAAIGLVRKGDGSPLVVGGATVTVQELLPVDIDTP